MSLQIAVKSGFMLFVKNHQNTNSTDLDQLCTIQCFMLLSQLNDVLEEILYAKRSSKQDSHLQALKLCVLLKQSYLISYMRNNNCRFPPLAFTLHSFQNVRNINENSNLSKKGMLLY
ncbi:hypothetical protein CHS0354_012125 [Potamilus streckersoni]|uniref:Uncharacterized protein n=1 Tax=Potamilus streckersoni TaxID=2493646 RepID=A0AAE0SA56_9BIVA|nr:hypothetical protein CHS0354_012125 [Potamilus streckersoni]